MKEDFKSKLLVSRLNTGYSNGNYKCRIGDEESVIGLYYTSVSLVGEWMNEREDILLLL